MRRKKGADFSAPKSEGSENNTNVTVLLERVAHRELHSPVDRKGLAVDSERACLVDSGIRGQRVEADIVERIVGFPAELQGLRFRDIEQLMQPQIRIEVSRTEELVTTLVAEAEDGSVGSGARPLDDG